MPAARKRYPGRDRVMHRADARDLLWRQTLAPSLAPWCENPVTLHAIGLPGPIEALASDNKKLPLTMEVACRKCPGCLRHRRNVWTARASDELQKSSRSWFLTLTVAPEHRFRLAIAAEKQHLRPGGETLGDLSSEEHFKLMCKALNRELTLSLKRMRKKAPFRFLAVFERHKDGFPHLHLLIHEQGKPLTKSSIQAEWRLGFSQCKLVEQGPKAAFYVAKYLAKEASTRVRASVRYGNSVPEYITEHLREMCDAVERNKRSNGPD